MSVKSTFKAKTIEEVLELLSKYKEKATLIAGGTDLVIELRNKKIDPEVIIDISHINELRYIKQTESEISLGAGTTFTDIAYAIELGKKLEGLKKSARLVGSPLIRNRGTVGGNICHGSPAADIVPPLLALDARVTIRGKDSVREEKIEDIFLGKGHVDIGPEEMLTDIKFKKPSESAMLGFSKLGLRNALAISRICIAAYIELDKDNKITDIRIASGALGVNGLRERSVEDAMIGRVLNEETVEIGTKAQVDAVEERLNGRSSLIYKGEAVKSLFKEAISLSTGRTFS